MMASALASLCSGLAALAFCAIIGTSIARRLFADRMLAAAVAPALGWATFSALALPILCAIGFGPGRVALVATAFLALALLDRRSRFAGGEQKGACVPAPAYVLAAAAAGIGAWLLLPKGSADAVLFAAPIFDHSKVAIIDEIARNGVPAVNPFYAQAGERSPLAYYYLWHFSAAMLALLPGVTGWEADVGLTAFTAFAATSIVMGLAVRIAGRASAAYWALAISCTTGAWATLATLFGPEPLSGWTSAYPGLSTPFAQGVWAPQHVASAASVVIAALLIERLSRAPDALGALALGLVAATAFGSSVWVGGVTFAVVAAAAGACALALTDSERRARFAVACLGAAAVAALCASPILLEQARAATVRPEGFPVAFHPYEVLGPLIPDALRRLLDAPAFWLVRLPLDAPAVALIGGVALASALLAGGPDRRRDATLAAAAAASLATSWLFISTVLNNDLGWRAALPAFLILTAFGGAAMARWAATGAWAKTTAGAAAIAIGLQGAATFVADNASGRPFPASAAFARSPDVWTEVRRRSSPTERVLSNPALFAEATPWPINLSWALLSDRRSCYAAWEFARPFAPLGRPELERLDRRFADLFAGRESDPYGLLRSHDCRLVVLNRADGAWADDPFAKDGRFLALPAPDGWRIYRVGDPETAR